MTVITELDALLPSADLYASSLPLAAYGLGWLLPALAAALAGGLIGVRFPRPRRPEALPDAAAPMAGAERQ